jgi:hypothetical protein
MMSSPSPFQLLQDAASDWCQSNLNAETIAETEEKVLELSRKLAESMMAATVKKLDRKTTYHGTSVACECGGRARFVEYRSRWIRTMCGDVQITRAYYHCSNCHHGVSPWDSSQGFGSRIWSPGVKALVGELCARLTYSEVSELLYRVLGFGIEESSQQDIVSDMGTRLREEESERIRACFEPDQKVESTAEVGRLYVSMDAAKAHTDGSWHDIKTGVVFEGIRPKAEGDRDSDEMLAARYVAAQETSEVFGRRIYAQARLSGLTGAREVVAIGDGAEWIWNTVALHFPGSVEILDYYHACEHIWGLASVLYGEGSEKGKRWAQTHSRRLKESGPRGLLRALKRRKAKTPEQQEALRLKLGYFQDHRNRMNYPSYVAKGMMIGSGPVESACKIVVGQRLKQAGMRWSATGADAILALRTAVLNGESERIQRLARAA